MSDLSTGSGDFQTIFPGCLLNKLSNEFNRLFPHVGSRISQGLGIWQSQVNLWILVYLLNSSFLQKYQRSSLIYLQFSLEIPGCLTDWCNGHFQLSHETARLCPYLYLLLWHTTSNQIDFQFQHFFLSMDITTSKDICYHFLPIPCIFVTAKIRP